MKTILKNGNLVTPYQILPNHTLVIRANKIEAILAQPPEVEPGDTVVDAGGKWVTPGFIDIHVHGALGVDTMHGSEAALHKIARFCAGHGVTSYLPTTWAASAEKILVALNAVAKASQPSDGARHLGVHIEGPYINPKFRGAQRAEVIRKPDQAEYEAWLATGVARLVTVAPEIEGADRFIDRMIQNRVEISIGHSGASYAEVIQAADRGVRHVTHLFNGMAGFHHRDPGILGACLSDDRLYVQIIPDGVHLHPAVVKTTIRAKSNARVILITDAVCGTAMPDGHYEFDGQKMYVNQGVARTPEGGLSGSTLTMDVGIRNVVNFTGLPFNEVLPMATAVPAEAIGLGGQKGVIKPGADADLLLLDAAFDVQMTIIAGQIVFEKK